MKQHVFKLLLIIEGSTEEVSQIYNAIEVNFETIDEQNCIS